MLNRFALITGGTGGLGTAVVHAALARGANVTVTYTIAAEAEALRESLGTRAADVRLVEADLARESATARVVADMPGLDIVLHLVGGYAAGSIAETTLATYQAQVAMNLTSTFLVARAALGRMLPAGYGRIVTVSSRAALEPTRGSAVYSAAKAAVAALTRALAADVRGTGVTVNAVAPSLIDTPANRAAMPDADTSLWVSTARLADTICYLASRESGDVNGAVIPVYGGL